MKKGISNLSLLAIFVSLLFASCAPKQSEEKVTSVYTKEQLEQTTPQQALNILKEGNIRFVESKMYLRDLNQQVAKTASGQSPFAAIVSCIDSRVTAENIFDMGIGDAFNARVAGNFVNDDILGGLEYSCKVVGSKVILVLGHTHCGAVKAACDNIELGNITSLVTNIKPAVEMVGEEIEQRNSKNDEFVELVAENNVHYTMKQIRERSSILNEMIENEEITLIGAMYDIETGKVVFYEE